MSESFEEQGRSPRSMRERELELEIARLNAELEAARGAEAADVTSRFLSMAAETVDLAMKDARREADEVAVEVSADAEARRDEATRLAEEAEARTESLRSQAENHEAVIDEAAAQADRIKADARQEADELVASERSKVAAEIETLSDVRSALEEERESIESYHDALRRRVQELAETMVTFMTTEPPIGAVPAIEDLVAPALMSGIANDTGHADGASETAGFTDGQADDDSDVVLEAPEYDVTESQVTEFAGIPIVDQDDDDDDEETAVAASLDHPEVDEAEVDEAHQDDQAEDDDESDPDSLDPTEELTPEELEAAVELNAQIDEAIDYATEGLAEPEPEPEAELELDPEPESEPSASSGLFARATESEIDGAPRRTGLFGAYGARLIEQTPPDALADALEDDSVEDERFRSFIDGDEDSDKSRDWLLRPERS